MVSTLIASLIILTAIPLGLFFKYLTKDYEQNLYNSKQYFPTFLWILAILAAISYTLNQTIALTLTYMFLMIFVWSR